MPDILYAKDVRIKVFHDQIHGNLQSEVNMWLAEQLGTEIVQILQTYTVSEIWITVVYKQND